MDANAPVIRHVPPSRSFGALLGGSSRSESYRTNWSVNVSQTVFDWGQFLSLKQAEEAPEDPRDLIRAALLRLR